MAHRNRLRIIAVVALCATGQATATAADQPPTPLREVYVALGDSYTSGPLIPNQHGDPIDCGRSDHNYPSVVAQSVKPARFVDVSCGSAKTRDMANAQTGLPAGGTNPPQFNGLRADATLVTVGIGGNDAGLVGVAEECAQLGLTAPTGTACRDRYAPGGKDSVEAKIIATAPKIAAVLQGIHSRSPRARTLIVGYPDVLPRNGGSCHPVVPLSPDDVRYIDGLIIRINAMIAEQAAANDAEYVDTYRDSIGHDVCTLPGVRWFEGLVPVEPAFPLHPNGQGEASMGRSVIAALNKPRPKAPEAAAPSASSRPVSAPRLSRLRVTTSSLRSGMRVSFRLGRPALVTLTVRRTSHSRALATIRVSGGKGANRAAIGTSLLANRTGDYVLSAIASAGGRTSTKRVIHFRLTR